MSSFGNFVGDEMLFDEYRQSGRQAHGEDPTGMESIGELALARRATRARRHSLLRNSKLVTVEVTRSRCSSSYQPLYSQGMPTRFCQFNIET
jgi:hypothetical protein